MTTWTFFDGIWATSRDAWNMLAWTPTDDCPNAAALFRNGYFFEVLPRAGATDAEAAKAWCDRRVAELIEAERACLEWLGGEE